MINLKEYEDYLNEAKRPKVTQSEINKFIFENGGSPLKEVRNSKGSIDWLYSTIKSMSESFANSTELRIKAASISEDFKKNYPNPIISESEESKTIKDLDELINSILY